MMSAVSAGMLIHAATVEMLAADFVFGDVSGGHSRHSAAHGHGHGHHVGDVEHGNDKPLSDKPEPDDGEEARLDRKCWPSPWWSFDDELESDVRVRRREKQFYLQVFWGGWEPRRRK